MRYGVGRVGARQAGARTGVGIMGRGRTGPRRAAGAGRLLLASVLVTAALAGCSAEAGPGQADRTGAGPRGAAADRSDAAGPFEPARKPDARSAPVEPAKRAGSVGAAGSACPLPVSFDLAAGWTAEAVRLEELTAGPVTIACEIDAKPAGHLGFLRVWTAQGGVPGRRAALRAFVAAETPDRDRVRYTETRAGDLPATEVSYLNTAAVLDGPKRERALAVETDGGLVVLHLGGADTAEHDAMMPAYALAKRSLRAS